MTPSSLRTALEGLFEIAPNGRGWSLTCPTAAAGFLSPVESAAAAAGRREALVEALATGIERAEARST